MNSLQTSGTGASGSSPPWVIYLSAWTVTLCAVLVVQSAQLSKFSLTPFLVVFTAGTLFSAWASRFQFSELMRAILGFLDGSLAFLAITAQSFLNGLFGIYTDPSVEIYLSFSLLWYLVLRSWLMVSLPAVAFQNVPVLALFGLIATYVLANSVLWLFACFVLAMLFALAVGHYVEWRNLVKSRFQQVLVFPLLKIALGFCVAGILFGMVMTPLLSLTFGQLISGIVVGLPLRPLATPPTDQSAPALQVGSGPTALSQMLLMRVKLEGDTYYPYLRIDTYDFYTGRGWNRRFQNYQRLFETKPNHFDLEGVYRYVPPGNRLRAEVKIVNGWHRTLYAPGFPLELSAPVSLVALLRSSAVLYAQPPLRAGEGYTVIAYAPPNDRRILRRTQSQLPSPFGAQVSFIREPNQRILSLVKSLSAQAPTDYDKVMAFKRYIEQNAVYNLNIEPYPSGVDVVEHFLFEAKEGYCIEFATALAVMCQYAGLPARVVSGFILKEQDPETGEYLVREEHRHLWTEVYFDGVGWVAFDATENASVVAEPNSELAGSNDPSSRRSRFSLERFLIDSAIVLGVLYLLYTLGGSSLFALRMRRQPPETRFQMVRSQLYGQLLFWLRLAGMPDPKLGQTPANYLNSVVPRLKLRSPQAGQVVEELIPSLMRLLYARPQIAELEQEGIQTHLRALKRILRQEIGWVRLTLELLRLGWQRAYGEPVSTVHSAQG